MKLRDMLTEVGILVPSDIPPEVQVSWMNQVQNSLYRFYGTADTPFNIVVQPTVSFYDLPTNCQEDRVYRLVVDGNEVPYVPPYEDNELLDGAKYWSVLNKQVFISPVPNMMVDATLYYKPSPTPLSLAAIDSEPTFPGEFIELLILGCAVKVAIAIKSDILSVLQMQYETLQRKAEMILSPNKQKRVNIKRSWD